MTSRPAAADRNEAIAPPLIEACVDDLDSVENAVAGGAGRLELCDNLADGGTTPSHGIVITLLDRFPIPLFPMVRLRGGSFRYRDNELAVMLRDVEHFASLGVEGLVFGALDATGSIDRDAVARVRDAAPDVELTFHRAFDVCRDPFVALESLIDLGVDRILTSGQRSRAWEGRELIAALVRQSAARIIILAGGGIGENDARELVRETGVREIHVRGGVTLHENQEWKTAYPVPFRKALPEDELARTITDRGRIAAIRAAVSTE